MKLYLRVSPAFIAHASLPHFLFKMRKNKKQVCCCFCPFKLKTPWLGQSCRRSRSLSLSSATKIFVGTETRSENNIGFSGLRVMMHSAGRVHINWDNFFKLLKIFMGMQVAANNDSTIRICFQANNNCL